MAVTRILAIFTLSLSLLPLGACQTLNQAWEDIKGFEIGSLQNNEQRDAAEIPLICPTVQIVDELSSLSDFSDPSDPAEYNLISRVSLNQVESSCNYDGRNTVVDLKLAFEGQLGPRAKTKDTDRPNFSYPFFIAVTDSSGNIKAKEIFGASMTYNANERHHTYYESLRQIIPVTGETEARQFTVLIGFQLSPQQLKYNRKNMVPVLEESRLLQHPVSENQKIRVVQNGDTAQTQIQITDNNAIVLEPAKTVSPEALVTNISETSAMIKEPSVASASSAPAPITKPQKKPDAPVTVATLPTKKPAYQPAKKEPAHSIPSRTDTTRKAKATSLSTVQPSAGRLADQNYSNQTDSKSAIFRNAPVSKSALPPPPSQSGLSAPREATREPISVIDLTAPLGE